MHVLPFNPGPFRCRAGTFVPTRGTTVVHVDFVDGCSAPAADVALLIFRGDVAAEEIEPRATRGLASQRAEFNHEPSTRVMIAVDAGAGDFRDAALAIAERLANRARCPSSWSYSAEG